MFFTLRELRSSQKQNEARKRTSRFEQLRRCRRYRNVARQHLVGEGRRSFQLQGEQLGRVLRCRRHCRSEVCLATLIFFIFLASSLPRGIFATKTAMTSSALTSLLLAASVSLLTWALLVPDSTMAPRSSPSTGTFWTLTTAILFRGTSGDTLRLLLLLSTLLLFLKLLTLMRMA